MARNYGGLSPYYTAADNTLEQYVPLPFQEMMAASNAIYQRGEPIENQRMAADSLLANIDALSPEHRNYVNQRASTFREDSNKLLDQYGGNAADPEYIRKTKQLIMQYANDGNFKTIASANERLRINDKIAREMRAKGQLYVRPDFTGIGANGQLTDDVGEIQLVDTLDKLRGEYEVAWKSMENNNRGTITNKANIDRLNNRVIESLKNQSPEFQRLAAAYREQGMTMDQAARQIQSDITGLQGQYGIRTERDNSYYSYQLALRQDARSAQKHNMEMAALKQAMMGQQAPMSPPKFVSQQDAVKGEKLNAEKADLVKTFRNHIGKDGNLDIKSGRTTINVNPYSQSGSVISGMRDDRIVNSNAALQGRSVKQTLDYMRNELGWHNKKGSAKQVADAYESMIKNDNLVPTYWVPTNSAMHSNLENMFKSDFAGRNAVIDGKTVSVSSKDAGEYQKNATLRGISLSSASGQPVFKYSTTNKDGKNAVIEIPMPNEWASAVRDRTKLSSIIQNNFDNDQIYAMTKNDDSLIFSDGTNLYAPRRTANGVRYAKIKNTNSVRNGYEFERDANKNLMYIDDTALNMRLNKELSDLTAIISEQSSNE